jgi:hypothetical protein
MIRNILFFLLFTFLYGASFAQNSDFHLDLVSGKTKYTITPENKYYIRFEFDMKGDSMKTFIRSIKSHPISVDPSAITVTPLEERIVKDGYDCFNSKTYTNFSRDHSPVTLPRNRIAQISFQTVPAFNCEVAGVIITGIGLVLTVIVAPLVSINYNTGKINEHTYFKIAGAGLALGTISIPLFIFSRERKFTLIPMGAPDKRVWKTAE